MKIKKAHNLLAIAICYILVTTLPESLITTVKYESKNSDFYFVIFLHFIIGIPLIFKLLRLLSTAYSLDIDSKYITIKDGIFVKKYLLTDIETLKKERKMLIGKELKGNIIVNMMIYKKKAFRHFFNLDVDAQLKVNLKSKNKRLLNCLSDQDLEKIFSYIQICQSTEN